MPKRSRTPRRTSTPSGAGTSATPTTPEILAGATVPPLEPGVVVVHDGLAVIEVADPADLTALLADPRLAELVLARIGECAAVALPQAAPRLLLALAKAGHTPTVEGAP